jgi:hypothetical protein
MSTKNGEKARANIARKRRTAQRVKDTAARAAAKQPKAAQEAAETKADE